MDLWGAGINFILDGEKTKRPEKIFKNFGASFKNKSRDARILE